VSSSPRRTATATLLAALLGSLLALVAAAPAGATTAEEVALYDATNGSRAGQGLGALQFDAGASRVALAWAQHLAASGSLRHNPNLAADVDRVEPRWTRIGENVGVGSGVDAIQAAFMASPAHRANVVGRFNRVGVGAVRGADGRLWVVVVFVEGPRLASAPRPTAPAAAPARPVSPIGSLDVVSTGPLRVAVQGWTLDPDVAAPVEVHVYVDVVGTGLGAAAGARPDVAAAYPGYGPAHGFSASLATTPGSHRVCAYGINVGAGANSQLGCRTVVVPG